MGRGRIWVTDCAVREEARKGTTGRREEGKNLRIYLFQIRTKIAHRTAHGCVRLVMCDFEKVLFSKENIMRKSHKFAQCEQTDHGYSLVLFPLLSPHVSLRLQRGKPTRKRVRSGARSSESRPRGRVITCIYNLNSYLN